MPVATDPPDPDEPDPDEPDPDNAGPRRDAGSTAYRPPAALVDLVKARDGRCRFPGCTINARFCDVDHVRPWPRGQTDAANLMCLCRRHHRVKQSLRWRVRIEPDATVTWTDPTGRVRTTLPQDFLQCRDGDPSLHAARSRAGHEPGVAAPVDEPGVLWSAWEEELAHELVRAELHANRRRRDRAGAGPGRRARPRASGGVDPPF